MKGKSVVGHRNRKNPRSREEYRTAKHTQNAQRSKQEYDLERKGWIRK
jgi:G:T-mismatch repair DNA endonuclease (very short patch repair protein)